ncbi:mCpol domain-containing protein [Actinomadura sp. NPDC000600]|uniref:mCpol domain-containing protein n=1 Tax=Actinomadura sp. NPDC000600 TaxID=3154262 RepID=UPI003397C3FD
MSTNWFLALDGDDIGRRLEMFMVTEDMAGLREFADTFDKLLTHLLDSIKQNDAIEVLLQGGDSILLLLPESELLAVVNLVTSISSNTGYTFSGGYAKTLRGAYIALKLAKAAGKNRIVPLDSKVDS